MLSAYARSVLIHELHAREASVDQVISYVVIMDKYTDGVLSTIPCPRCYADGRAIPLILLLAGSELRTGSCDGCAAVFALQA